MTLSRRRFLKSSAVSLGALTLLPGVKSSAFEEQRLPHFFLNLRFNGAWDTTLAFDAPNPADLMRRGFQDGKDYFYLYGESDLKKVGQVFFAPPAHALLPHFEDIAFVNGMHMLPNNPIHEINREYMVSGSTDNGDPAFAFQLAQSLSEKSAREAKGVLHQYEYERINFGDYRRHRALVALKKTGGSPESDIGLGDIFDDFEPSQAKSRGPYREIGEVERLDRQIYKSYEKYRALLPDPNEASLDYLALVLAGFASGYYEFGILDFVKDFNLDTHGKRHRTDQPTNLTKAFSNLSDAIRFLKQTTFVPAGSSQEVSFFDVTTVVVTSEFARTIANDGQDGTDHNPKNNSCLLFGKRIRGGQIIGQSHFWEPKFMQSQKAELRALPFDYSKGSALDGATVQRIVREKIPLRDLPGGKVSFLFPENLWMTVADLFGLPDGTSLVKNALKLPIGTEP